MLAGIENSADPGTNSLVEGEHMALKSVRNPWGTDQSRASQRTGGMKSRFLRVMILVAWAAATASARPGGPVSVSSNGWTVTADADQGVLSVAHENLGTVLKNVRLNLQGERDLLRLQNWSVEKKG